MVEITFWWVFLLACVFGFFFGYGILEDLIRKWYSNRQIRNQKPIPRIDHSPDPSGNGHSDFVIH